MSDVLIGRQPIFDAQLTVVGYELLYRGDTQNQAIFLDGNKATSLVLSRAFMEIGVDNLVGDKLAFVNLPREFIVGEFEFPLNESQLVLEVLEDVPLDDEVVEALWRLKGKGFKIALDDIATIESVERGLAVADILKFDLTQVDRQSLPPALQIARRHPLQLLAEKVETQEELDWCRNLGFDLFQGYFLCRPNLISQRRLTTSALTIVQVLAEISLPDVEIDRLEKLVLQDVTLSFKILRLINSAAFGLNNEIVSLKQALSILGLRKLRSLLGFMLLDHAETKPLELIVIATIRGKMCEGVMDIAGMANPNQGFTVGFFSVLDALLDMPLESIMEQVPLALPIKAALTKGEGALGALLESVKAYEQGAWQPEGFAGLSSKVIQDCYVRSLIAAQDLAKLFKK